MLTEEEVAAEIKARWPQHPIRHIGNHTVLLRALLDDINRPTQSYTLTDEQVEKIAEEFAKIRALQDSKEFSHHYDSALIEHREPYDALAQTLDRIVTDHFRDNPNSDPIVEYGVRAGVATLETAFWERVAGEKPAFTVDFGSLSDGRRVFTACPAVESSTAALNVISRAKER